MRVPKGLLAGWSVAMVALGACGGSGADKGGVEPAETVAELRIVADDFSFQMPAEIDAGETKPFLRNDGEYPHQALLYKLNDGVDFDDFARRVVKDETAIPQLSEVYGGVSRIAFAGESASSLPEDLTPGTYAVMCFAHLGTEPKNHAEAGMLAELTVR